MEACINDDLVIRLLNKNNLPYVRTVGKDFDTIEASGKLNTFVVILDKHGCVERSILLPKELADKLLGEST